MTHFYRTTACAAALFALSGPVLADVTADDIWSEWKSSMEGQGYTVAADNVNDAGDDVSVTGLSLSMEIEESATKIDATIPSIVFVSQRGGTVDITMADQMTVTFSSRPEYGEAADGTVVFGMDGLVVTAAGDPDDIEYSYKANEVTASIASLLIDGETAPIVARMTMSGVTGNQHTIIGSDTRNIDGDVTVSEMTYVVDVNAEEDGKMRLTGTAEALRGSASGTMPLEMDPNDTTMLSEGKFDIAGTYDLGASNFDMFLDADGEQVSAQGGTSSSSFAFAFGPKGLAYGAGATDLDVTVSASELPLPPINIKMAEYGTQLSFPMLKSDEPQDFGLMLKLSGLEVSEFLWGMFDPQALLPRDPATLVVDLSGKANWLIDIFDPEVEAGMGEMEMPGELHSLTLNDLHLSIGGAELNGEGGFTFDNTDLVTFDGLPAPDGQVKLNLKGAFGLMDTLSQMGILPAEQAMGARMMLGLFAVPLGEDELESVIEVNGDGSIFANGQRLQ